MFETAYEVTVGDVNAKIRFVFLWGVVFGFLFD